MDVADNNYETDETNGENCTEKADLEYNIGSVKVENATIERVGKDLMYFVFTLIALTALDVQFAQHKNKTKKWKNDKKLQEESSPYCQH